ncbi:hypothetical protein chiPu_0017708 [Chiloscyllium punctatum]|uniref:Uncharacterized protein n=1 Tax=Chiloscyllium punctatum TaxID=137246 RepID=A0A401RIA8_CHIPU|nr:hypothetical protein [Chiloscyllium punctatum]
MLLPPRQWLARWVGRTCSGKGGVGGDRLCICLKAAPGSKRTPNGHKVSAAAAAAAARALHCNRGPALILRLGEPAGTAFTSGPGLHHRSCRHAEAKLSC